MPRPTDPPPAVVLDTNAVLDWQLFRDPRAHALIDALEHARVRWLATQPMLDELADVLTRSFGPRWEHQRERTLGDQTPSPAELHPPPPSAPAELHCTDPDDQKFVDLALHLGVRWLVTRDRALLALRRRARPLGLLIVRPQEWSPVLRDQA